MAVDDWSGFRAQEPEVPPEAGESGELDEAAEVDPPEAPAEPLEPLEPLDPDDEQAVITRAVAAAATATAARLGILMAPKVLQSREWPVRIRMISPVTVLTSGESP
ncbi:hypothetical protein GCM10009838_45720 [Catenulispora subtropica]|uniref:Uncharacterized protein n=1 Tax=Catenulispora subtropica TaxID=450798 RepID=A0ABP5DHT8_9ACTN